MTPLCHCEAQRAEAIYTDPPGQIWREGVRGRGKVCSYGECLLTSPPLSPSPSKEKGKRFIERGSPLSYLHGGDDPLPLLREGVRGWVAKQPPESRCFPLLAERELGCPGFNIIPRSISRANMAGGS